MNPLEADQPRVVDLTFPVDEDSSAQHHIEVRASASSSSSSTSSSRSSSRGSAASRGCHSSTSSAGWRANNPYGSRGGRSSTSSGFIPPPVENSGGENSGGDSSNSSGERGPPIDQTSGTSSAHTRSLNPLEAPSTSQSFSNHLLFDPANAIDDDPLHPPVEPQRSSSRTSSSASTFDKASGRILEQPVVDVHAAEVSAWVTTTSSVVSSSMVIHEGPSGGHLFDGYASTSLSLSNIPPIVADANSLGTCESGVSPMDALQNFMERVFAQSANDQQQQQQQHLQEDAVGEQQLHRHKSSDESDAVCPPGFVFGVYDADVSQHFEIASEDVVVTTGSIKYLDFFRRYGTQTRFRFQLCRKFFSGSCSMGIECPYIHSRHLPKSTPVHINNESTTTTTTSLPAVSSDMVLLSSSTAVGASLQQQQQPPQYAQQRQSQQPQQHSNQGHSFNSMAYETLPAGVVFSVYPPNNTQAHPQQIPSERILKTAGASNVYHVLHNAHLQRDAKLLELQAATGRPGNLPSVRQPQGLKPRHCAHFQFKKMCNLGSECNFIHSLIPFNNGLSGDTGLAPPYQPQSSVSLPPPPPPPLPMPMTHPQASLGPQNFLVTAPSAPPAMVAPPHHHGGYAHSSPMHPNEQQSITAAYTTTTQQSPFHHGAVSPTTFSGQQAFPQQHHHHQQQPNMAPHHMFAAQPSQPSGGGGVFGQHIMHGGSTYTPYAAQHAGSPVVPSPYAIAAQTAPSTASMYASYSQQPQQHVPQQQHPQQYSAATAAAFSPLQSLYGGNVNPQTFVFASPTAQGVPAPFGGSTTFSTHHHHH